jgi:hypothetical protein
MKNIHDFSLTMYYMIMVIIIIICILTYLNIGPDDLVTLVRTKMSFLDTMGRN